MSKCKYIVNDKEFDTIEEMYQYIAESNSNDVIPDNLTQQEVVDMIKKVGTKIDFRDKVIREDGSEEKVHEYKYLGNNMTPVSLIIEKQFPYKGGTPGIKGQKANTEGNEFHSIADQVIKGRNAGGSRDYVLNSLNLSSSEEYKKWAMQMLDMYEEWSDGGKNVVLSEFKIGSVTQEIAGTIDVAVIYPDGSLKIYDFKGTASKYLKDETAGSHKRRGNNLQMNLYKRLLEIGDVELGMKKIKVVGAAIIPIEFDISVDENDKATLIGFKKLGSFEMDELMDDKTPIFPENKVINRDISKFVFPVEGYEGGKAKLKSSRIADWKGFINQHLGYDLENVSYNNAARRIMNNSHKDEKTGQYFFTQPKTRKQIFYKDITAATVSGQAGRDARLMEIERDYKALFKQDYFEGALELIHFINYGKSLSVDMENNSSSLPNQLHTLAKKYKSPADRAVRASSVPGLEDVGDDVVVVYKGFNPDSGSFTSIDLITVNNDNLGSIKKKNEKGNSILGKYVSNAQAKIVAQQAGYNGVRVWDNSRKSAHLLKMGLIAAHLQRDNNKIGIGDLVVAKLGGEKGIDAIGVPVTEALKQLQILASVKIGGKSILDISYGEDTKITEMLKKKELLDPANYKYNNLEAYLRFAQMNIIYSRDDEGTQVKQIKQMKKWAKLGDNEKLLAGIYSDSGLTATLEMVEKNEDIHKQMLDALIQRQKYIEDQLGKDHDDAYTTNMEYQYVSRAILDMQGLTDQHSTFEDLDYHTRKLITPGMTGIAIVDQFIGRMQRTIADMNREMTEKHFNISIKKHQKLIKYTSGYINIAQHKAGDIYLPLLEHVTVPVEGNLNQLIRRPTGRFWPSTSDEYKNLIPEQKEYIEWYKEATYDALTYGMTTEKKAKFDQYWDKNMIPHMNPSLDTRLGDILGSKGSEGDKKQKLVAYAKRSLDPYASKNDYIEHLSDDYTEMVDQLAGQKQFKEDPIDVYGDVSRMERFGFTPEGLAKTSYVMESDPDQKEIQITRTMETNLESVLNHVVANKYRQEKLSHLVPEYKAMKGVIAAANSPRFKHNDLLMGYLKSFVEKNLFQKNQVTKDQELLAKISMGGKALSNLFLLDYNIVAQVKNTLAGFFHVTSTAIANPALGKYIFQAYLYTINPKNYNYTHSLMWSFGMSSSDTDQLVNGYYTNIGKRGAASSQYKHIINYAGDYYHRSVFMVANMMKDGTLETFTENKNVDGAWYDYDEDKDPRWKIDISMSDNEKSRRKAHKEFIKSELAKEGKLDDKGRMTVPYTSYDLQNMKRESNEAFEAQNNEDQENFRNGVEGILFGQYKSWWLQKVKRFALSGGVMSSAKELIEHAVVDPSTGLTEYHFTYEGSYMEGIGQTLFSIGNALKAMYDTRSFNSMEEWWGSISPKQKENVRRMLGDFALITSSLALGVFMFDDDDRNPDNAWYALWANASGEINTWSYLTATPLVGTGSSIPSLGLISKFLQNPLNTLTKPGFTKIFNFFDNGE